MKIHKEGFPTIALCALFCLAINLLSFYLLPSLPWLSALIFIASIGFLGFIISFFRVPKRVHTIAAKSIIAPADGKVVVIEEVVPDEYFTDKKIQVSIFMSPLNVHVNRNPISGEVVYTQYHKGKYLVAWHPKSSTENERHTVVIRNSYSEVLVKQIAGAVARRIVNYLPKTGLQVKQTEELGFIKFGSRVDLLLPLDAKIAVKIGDNVQGGVTTIAEIL